MKEITFSDILITPQYSEVLSRTDVDLTANLGKFSVALPAVSANMHNITGPKMAAAMKFSGGFGILHRFNPVEVAIQDFKETYELMSKDLLSPPAWPLYLDLDSVYPVGVSIGVQESDKERFDKLYEVGARTFCIDIAHGHSLKMKQIMEWIKGRYCSYNITLIAGNIATKEAALDLQEWGADILKVGIGPGAVCMTRKNTGVGVPQLHALKEVSSVAKVPIIADGGIKSVGDIAKALIFADVVMIGSFIAGTSETPGNVFRNENGQFYKVYGGSASAENKSHDEKQAKFVEGIMKTVPFQGHVKHILREIRDGLQSAFSYSGATTLKEYHSKVKWEQITNGSRVESKI